MKNKKILMGVGTTILIIILLVIGIYSIGEDKSASSENETTTVENEESTSSEQINENDEEKTPEEKMAGQKDTTSTKNNDSSNNLAGISFPYKIPNTFLILERIDEYTGTYVEDGSDSAVENIAAIVLKNEGDNPVEYAEIIIECAEGELFFTVSSLPAGKTVIVQEKNKRTFEKFTLLSCKAEIAEIEVLEMNEDTIEIEENEMSLRVRNISDKDIPCVRIFYKYFMEDQDAYVGGITYTVKIDNLKAGEEKTVTPKHYAKGSCKIMMVRLYESAE